MQQPGGSNETNSTGTEAPLQWLQASETILVTSAPDRIYLTKSVCGSVVSWVFVIPLLLGSLGSRNNYVEIQISLYCNPVKKNLNLVTAESKQQSVTPLEKK